MEEKIIMSKKEILRAEIITKVINKRLFQTEACKLLNISYRQTNRLVNKVKTIGISSLAHGNRGKKSKNKISKNKESKIITIYQKTYPDFGPTFACE